MKLMTAGWDILAPLVRPAETQATSDRALVENIWRSVFPSKSGIWKATVGMKATSPAETGITPNAEMDLFGVGEHKLVF